jgi:TatD DNase family protein
MSGSGLTLVDTHAHLDFSQFDADREEVLNRAQHESVTQVITVGYDLKSSRQAVTLAREHLGVRACVGVHPHEAGQVGPGFLDKLEELSQDPEVVGIGEIGLDYYRDRSPRGAQREVFEQQLGLAARLKKPVVVHDREAHGDVMSTIRQFVDSLSASEDVAQEPLGVMHCFSGDQSMAEELFALGFYVSVAGPVTYRNAKSLQDLVGRLPLERLLVETDCPFLAPDPYRGQRNEPARVRVVATKIAEIRDLPLDDVASITTANAHRLFRLDKDGPPGHCLQHRDTRAPSTSEFDRGAAHDLPRAGG